MAQNKELDFHDGIATSKSGGANALFKGGGILPTNAVRISDEVPFVLNSGVVQDAVNSSKLQIALVNVESVGSKYALLTTTAGLGTSLTASAPAAASVGVASAQALAANTSRRGLVLTNTSANQISVAFGATAVLASGITLNANGGTFVMDSGTFSSAAVNAIAAGAASNLAIQEFT